MKKKILVGLLFLVSFVGICSFTSVSAQNAPNYDQYFAGKLTDGDISVWNPGNGAISSDKSLRENIEAVIKPGISNGGFLRNVVRNIALGVLILYLVIAGAQLLVSANKADDLKTAMQNLGYIAIGALFIYAAGWLFGDVLNAEGLQGTEQVADAIATGKTSLLFQVLSLLKGAAFFVAIIMIVVTGFKVISAADADKSKKLVRGLINVIAALAVMKVVDFVYYIASVENFASHATDLILNAARFFGYVYGAVAVLMVFYAGYSFLTDGGRGEGFKRAKNILINLLVSGLVLFGFLLILYQIFAEFTQ